MLWSACGTSQSSSVCEHSPGDFDLLHLHVCLSLPQSMYKKYDTLLILVKKRYIAIGIPFMVL